jgi:tetratricopeptide (TPR) repeat protein
LRLLLHVLNLLAAGTTEPALYTTLLSLTQPIRDTLETRKEAPATDQMYQRALVEREKALGADHTSTLDTVHNLGSLYHDQSKLNKAEKMYQRALAEYGKAVRADHTSTLDTVNNLGSLYRNRGKLDEAEQMYQRALLGFQKSLGSNHTLTLTVMTNLKELQTRFGRAMAGLHQSRTEGKLILHLTISTHWLLFDQLERRSAKKMLL